MTVNALHVLHERLTNRTLSAGIALLFIACGEGPLGDAISPDWPVNTVVVRVPAATMIAGDTMTATVALKDVRGGPLRNRQVAWSTNSSAIAAVTQSGVISAIAAGVVVVTASSEGKSGSVSIAISPPPVATVEIAPASDTLIVGAHLRLNATARDSKGNALSGRAISWTSSVTSVATIDSSGLVTAIGAGSSSIAATSEGKSASIAVIVIPPPVASISVTLAANTIVIGASTTAIATLRDVGGTVLTARAISWSTSTPSIATVDADGRITAIAAGVVYIIATSEGKSAQTSLTVIPPPVATVGVSLTTSSIVPGSTSQATATLKDVSGQVLSGRSVAWSTSASSVATVDANGLITAVSIGSATVTATSEGKSGSASISVIPPPVATVAVSVTSAIVALGTTTTATVVLKDAKGVTLTGRIVTWASSAPSVATIDNNRVVTGVALGTARITATSEGVTGEVTVTVVPPSLNLSIPKAYIVQTVQTEFNGVQLVAGKPGLLRAFVSANLANTAKPSLRASIYNAATLLRTVSVSATRANVPLTSAEGPIADTWNVLLNANEVQPGLRVDLEVDPGNAYIEINESDNTYQFTPLVVSLPTFQVRFVPVRQTSTGALPNLTPSNISTYLAATLAMHPISDVSADIRSVYTTTSVIGPTPDDGWNTILAEINVLRLVEDPSRYFYGALRPVTNLNCCAGLGYLGLKSSIGLDADYPTVSTIAAHEWGHNFNRQHAPCGNPLGPDPSYPYVGAVTGAWGYDLSTGQGKPPTMHDLMSYCDIGSQWVSDYTYKGVFGWRQAALGPAQNSVAENSLIVWGKIRGNTVTLEPSFESMAIPSLPEGIGSSRIEAFDANGATIFSYAIEGATIADDPRGERQFAYAIPLSSLRSSVIDRLRLTHGNAIAERSSRVLAPNASNSRLLQQAITSTQAQRANGGATVRWDAGAFPLVVVRDPTTKEILSLARGGAVSLPMRSSTVELQLSDGVGSRTVVLPIR